MKTGTGGKWMNHSFVRFLMVGVVNTLVGLGSIYLLLHGTGASYWVATFLGNAIGACVSYVLNRVFTFKSQSPVSGSIMRFIAVILACYVIAYYAAIRMAVWGIHALLPEYGQAADDAAVLIGTGLYTLLNYAGQRWLVFPPEKGVGSHL
ncbi:GtrA family protein [Fictibacillus enclensis]|uniref:GtrA family protein n=1 Tax=Fictibacillus enclensis TaxID=1017270 RepID=UPI0025A0992D|nr:GtrA family protein [Fictibacillus enclensis]MDM5339997.1 GtrA family protein [Fictibacillus enclensis]